MADLLRRDFLKVVGLTGTSAAVGCSSESARKLIPYIIPPEDIVPGRATWYATTCRECPAGCGLLAKNRDGRVIKVEGNPVYPVNRGALCARGQASLQGLYSPDRFAGPMKRTPKGKFRRISWKEATKLLVERMSQVLRKGREGRVLFMNELVTDSLMELMTFWLDALGSPKPVLYEPFAYEPLRKANTVVFGMEGIPTYRIDRADFLIAFGADFLETWLSPVQYSRQFAAFRDLKERGKNSFVYVGPRLSLTAANADHWVSPTPGEEYLVALGMIQIILKEDLVPGMNQGQKEALLAMTRGWSLDAIGERTGVEKDVLRHLARRFAMAERPLALTGGVVTSGLNGTETAIAANVLCTIANGTRDTIDFSAKSSLSQVAQAEDMRAWCGRMSAGEIDLLMINSVNPVFSLPPSWGFLEAMEAVPFVVSFSSITDETTEHADLVLPVHTALESWGDYSPRQGVFGMMQPVMGPLLDTRHLGDILLSTGKHLDAQRFPWEDFYEWLRVSWENRRQREAWDQPSSAFWPTSVRRGGVWELDRPSDEIEFNGQIPELSPSAFAPRRAEEGFHLIAYPTIQFFDGRGANRPWLQELPDPLMQATWGGWIEIHPETAQEMGVKRGDMLRLRSATGTLELPANPYAGVPPHTLAAPIGQGHTAYRHFARGLAGNPMTMLPDEHDPACSGRLWTASGVSVEKLNRTSPIANTDGSGYQMGRELAQSMSIEDYLALKKGHHKPHLRLPLPEGYDPKKDFYPPHDHVNYRWGMVVDLDRCTACGACVVACYAENNVAVVGRKRILQGREMSWLRIQRYFDADGQYVRFLPMLCQHCDNAPCESVCPVYAPHHSVEGLNNQVYNRCIGTRFCSQNCPYKVRRFNWFTFTHTEPLNWQLNPDVTVRQKGVMEKCSFCVQRIVEAKNEARNEGRMVKDGEVTPACVQTCPTGALVFGNLMDSESRVSKLIHDVRAYQVFEHLNTKPAVIYLRKVTQPGLFMKNDDNF